MLIYISIGLNLILICVAIMLYISNKNNEDIINKLIKEIDMYKEISKYYKNESIHLGKLISCIYKRKALDNLSNEKESEV